MDAAEYTEVSRRAIFGARYEAYTRGVRFVEPEHIVLGLLRADPQLFRFCAPELNADQIRSKLEPRLSRRRTLDRKDLIPFSRAAKRVLNLAEKESHNSGHAKIGTEHILAALIGSEQSHSLSFFRKRPSWIYLVFREGGVDTDQILAKIRDGQVSSRPKDKRATAALGGFKAY